jgi:hypothetical protein
MRDGLPISASRRWLRHGHAVVAARRGRHQAGFGRGQDRRVAQVAELVFQLQGVSIHAVRLGDEIEIPKKKKKHTENMLEILIIIWIIFHQDI